MDYFFSSVNLTYLKAVSWTFVGKVFGMEGFTEFVMTVMSIPAQAVDLETELLPMFSFLLCLEGRTYISILHLLGACCHCYMWVDHSKFVLKIEIPCTDRGDVWQYDTGCYHPSFGMLNYIVHTGKVLMRLAFGMCQKGNGLRSLLTVVFPIRMLVIFGIVLMSRNSA